MTGSPQSSPPPSADNPKHPPRKGQGVWRAVRALLITLVTVLLVLTLCAGGAYWFLQQQIAPMTTEATLSSDERFEFEIQEGWGANQIASELKRQGFIRNDRLFSLWVRYQNIDRQLGEGLYYLSPNMTMVEIADELAKGGQPRTAELVIPEGYRATDVAKALFETLGETEDARSFKDIVYYIRQPERFGLLPDYLEPYKDYLATSSKEDDPERSLSLEGYLFPATYAVPIKSNAKEAITQLLTRFSQELEPDINDKLAEAGFNVHEWVTLASIIQSEAGSDEEMATIAGVFLNRIDRGMRLESDPTVAYGLFKNLNQLDASAGDFTADKDHPWNSYTRVGLPFGPISNPGHAALQSVFAPTRNNDEGTNYLYFLHSPDGGFHPNTNLNDHNRDVQLYLR